VAPRNCIFCGNRANSVEDAIPRWMLEHHAHVFGSGPTARRWGALDDPRHVRQGTWDGLAVQVRSVCRDHCNSGWLSELESQTLTLVKPMMSGLAVRLHETDQRTLGFWAVKTAITMQEANRRLGLPIPKQHAAALYHARLIRPRVPPSQITVWLARHRGPSVGLAYLVLYTIASPGTLSPRNTGEQHRYWVGLRIGNVAFHILGHTMEPANVRVAENSHALIRIWPPAAPIAVWPPYVGFDDHEFEVMARTSLPQANWRSARILIPRRAQESALLASTGPVGAMPSGEPSRRERP
jgi:hypothetical protein